MATSFYIITGITRHQMRLDVFQGDTGTCLRSVIVASQSLQLQNFGQLLVLVQSFLQFAVN